MICLFEDIKEFLRNGGRLCAAGDLWDGWLWMLLDKKKPSLRLGLACHFSSQQVSLLRLVFLSFSAQEHWHHPYSYIYSKLGKLRFRVAVISAKNHERQRRKRQSVTAKREKSQTPKVLTAILTLPNLT